jgi:hypothetical protein
LRNKDNAIPSRIQKIETAKTQAIKNNKPCTSLKEFIILATIKTIP